MKIKASTNSYLQFVYKQFKKKSVVKQIVLA